MLTKNRAYEIIDLITSHTNYYVAVDITMKQEGLTRFANSEIHQNVYNDDCEVKINLFGDKKISIVSTNVLDDGALLEALKDAENKLEFLPVGHLELPELKDSLEIVSESYNSSLNNEFDTLRRAELLKKSIDLLDDDFIAAGAFSLKNIVLAWGNSHGVKRYVSNSSVDLNAMVMHESGASGYIETSASDAKDIDVVREFTKAYNKSKQGLNPISIEPEKYDVILEPLAVGDILMYTGYIGANSKFHQIGMSCFTGKVGEQVMGSNINISDDIMHPKTNNLPFDFEGHPRQPLKIIEKGILKNIAYDTITAMAENKETTGHSVGYAGEGGIPLNLVMEGGNSSLDEMIQSTKRGLLVSRFHYMNIVDPTQGVLTALTRDGLFLIEDGKVTKPVYNLRFTDSINHVFNNVVELSKDREKTPGFFGNLYVPAIKVKDFSFTGKTQIES